MKNLIDIFLITIIILIIIITLIIIKMILMWKTALPSFSSWSLYNPNYYQHHHNGLDVPQWFWWWWFLDIRSPRLWSSCSSRSPWLLAPSTRSGGALELRQVVLLLLLLLHASSARLLPLPGSMMIISTILHGKVYFCIIALGMSQSQEDWLKEMFWSFL